MSIIEHFNSLLPTSGTQRSVPLQAVFQRIAVTKSGLVDTGKSAIRDSGTRNCHLRVSLAE